MVITSINKLTDVTGLELFCSDYSAVWPGLILQEDTNWFSSVSFIAWTVQNAKPTSGEILC